MEVYLIPLILCFFCSISYDINGRAGGRPKFGDKFWWGFLFVYLTALLGLRFEVGGDTIMYMGEFKWAQDLDSYTFISKNRFEPFYNLLVAVSRSLSKEFYVFQIIHALIFNTLLFIFLQRSTRYKYTALLFAFMICYYYYGTEILRETLAIMIFMFNYQNLVKHRWIIYYLGVTLSCLFHISAVILIVLPFLIWLKLDAKFILLIALAGLSVFFLDQMFALFSDIEALSKKIESYENDKSHGMLADSLSFLRDFLFPLVFCYVVKFKTPIKLRYENMILVMVLLGLYALFNPIIFSRFCNYFKLFLVIAISDAFCELIRRKKILLKQYAIILFTGVAITYGTYYWTYNTWRLWIPYHSIFDPVKEDRDIFNVH